MAGKVLSDEETEQLSAWRPEVARSDLVAHFTLSFEDRRWIGLHRGAAERIGLAVQLCGLGYLGFVPAELAGTPRDVVAFVAKQIGVAQATFGRYAREVEGRTRHRHVAAVVERTGWRVCGAGEWKAFGDWLTARALEHDTPSVLFRQALQQLRADRVVRPGLDRLMRAVSTARVTAIEEIRRRLDPELAPERCDQLDALVATDAEVGVARLAWLNDGAASASAEWVKLEVAKLSYLEGLGAHRLDLSAIPPERLRQLATLARRSTPRALRQIAPERRHPILLGALAAAHSEIDEIVRLFDMVLANTDGNARDQVAERQAEAVRTDVGRRALLDDIFDVVLDPDLDDAAVGAGVRGLGPGRLAGAARSDGERLPRDGGHLELMEARFSHVRSFAPQALGALAFAASVSPSEVLTAVVALQAMSTEGRRVPDDATVDFVPARWRSYLDAARAACDENLFKHYWELLYVLFALQGGSRSGEIWMQGSQRYANPASYLIPVEAWPAQRGEVQELTGMPATFAERLVAIDEEMGRYLYLDDLETLLDDPDGPVSVDSDGQLHLKALTAEVLNPEVLAERDAVVARLPMVPLTELLIEVDRETGFSAHLTHAGGASPCHPEMEHRRNLYAAIVSLACNFGSTRMAELTGISADTIDWTIQWYLREETLRAANAAIVNAHHRYRLAASQGCGDLSSSDGLRMPMRGKSLTGRALSRYLVHEGLTSYTHIFDQYSTYGTQIIVSTERDATFTLDEILGNTTELAIIEHTTDGRGQTLATFALFDLVGFRSPRIAKLTEAQLWRPYPPSHYQRWPRAGPLLEHHAQVEVIAEHWDDLAHIGGSLKLGHVSAALLIAKLQAGSRQHPLAKAMLEYGKLLRTLHALRWFTDEAFRRRIGRQLNRGEATNDLRRFIFFANRGAVRYPHHDDQTTQAHCHTLVVNACVLSTTGYLEDAIAAEQTDGHEVGDEAKAHLSFSHFEAIKTLRDKVFDIAGVLKRSRRPLRRPVSPARCIRT